MPQTATRSDLLFLFYGGAKFAGILALFEAESCLFFHSKTLEPVFSQLCFSKVQIQNTISQSFALRKLGEVSIDPKFYLALGSGHNSIPQKSLFDSRTHI